MSTTPILSLSPVGTPLEAVDEEAESFFDFTAASEALNIDTAPSTLTRELPAMPRATPSSFLPVPQLLAPWLTASLSPNRTPPAFEPPSQSNDYFDWHTQLDDRMVPDLSGGEVELWQEPDFCVHVQAPEQPSQVSLSTAPIEHPAARVRVRNARREALLSNPLSGSELGRVILSLGAYRWFTLPNGLSVMRFGIGESSWRANDVSTSINWLACGAYCHRSHNQNIIGVANIAALNALIAASGGRTIAPSAGQPNWGAASGARAPSFMRRGFVSRHISDPTA